MKEGLQEMTHAFCQRGQSMRLQEAEHPLHSRDLTNVFESRSGRKIRSDAQGSIARSGKKPNILLRGLRALRNRQKKAPWRTHQNLAHHRKGRCAWEGCPGKKVSTAERPRSYDTTMRCEECSALLGKDMFFCNNTKKGVTVHCHETYHIKYCNKKHSKPQV